MGVLGQRSAGVSRRDGLGNMLDWVFSWECGIVGVAV